MRTVPAGLAPSSLTAAISASISSIRGATVCIRRSPTEAGERLMQTVAPRMLEIEAEMAAVSELGAKPAGTVRITAIDYAIDSVLSPRLAPLLSDYPDVKV